MTLLIVALGSCSGSSSPSHAERRAVAWSQHPS